MQTLKQAILTIAIIITFISGIDYALADTEPHEAEMLNDTILPENSRFDFNDFGAIQYFNLILPIALILGAIIFIVKHFEDRNLIIAMFSLTATCLSFIVHEFALIYLHNLEADITNASTIILFCVTILLFVRWMDPESCKLLVLNFVGFSLLAALLVVIARVTQFSLVQVASFTALGFISAIIIIVIVVNTFVE